MRLVNKVISESRAAGGRILSLKTTNVREAAIGLYTKVGFRKVRAYWANVIPPVMTGIETIDFSMKL